MMKLPIPYAAFVLVALAASTPLSPPKIFAYLSKYFSGSFD